MTAPRVLPLLLAFALLLGQQGAQAHALSHLNPTDGTKEQLTHSALCAKCSSFQQLSSVVPPSATTTLETTLDVVHRTSVDVSVARITTVPFHSRAPPLLA